MLKSGGFFFIYVGVKAKGGKAFVEAYAILRGLNMPNPNNTCETSMITWILLPAWKTNKPAAQTKASKNDIV